MLPPCLEWNLSTQKSLEFHLSSSADLLNEQKTTYIEYLVKQKITFVDLKPFPNHFKLVLPEIYLCKTVHTNFTLNRLGE